MTVRLYVIACVLLVVGSANARAQGNRADVLAEQQKEKAGQLTPWVPGRIESAVIKLKQDLIDSPNGLYPTFDSVYSGGGFTLGAGYRRYYTPTTFWNVTGMYSFKGYSLMEGSTTSQGWLGGRLDWTGYGGRRDATEVQYFGLGNDTAGGDVPRFRMTQLYIGASTEYRPARWLRATGAATYESYEDEPEELTSFAPGAGANPDFLHLQGGLAYDSRRSPGYTRTGGMYGASLHAYIDQDDGAYSFQRLDLDAVHHIPVHRETWVVSLRGRVQTTLSDEDDVPYFLMPSVGGGHSLRAYSSFRFRDRHTLLTSAEWRWFPNLEGIDMALFADAGKVAPELDGLDFKDMHTNWGVGFRVHGLVSTPLRIDLARGAEGWHLNFAGSAAF
jgi:hypothetical protein